MILVLDGEEVQISTCIVGSSTRRLYDSAARIRLPVINHVLEETRREYRGEKWTDSSSDR